MLRMQQRLSVPFLVLLSLPSTAMGFALSVQISALSWLLSTRYGLDIHEIGIVWAAGPLAGIVGQLLIGIVSDKVWLWGGRRRPFIIVGGVLTALMLTALPSIGAISTALGLDAILGVAIAVALGLDLAINVSFNPTRSIITDVTPEGAQRTAGYTWMQTVSGSFGVLAYAIGAVFGNIALIYFGALLVLAFSIVPALLVEEPRMLAAGGAEPGPAPKVGLLQLLDISRPLLAFLAYNLMMMGLKLGGIQPPGHWLEIGFGLFATLLIVQALAAPAPRGEFLREDLAGFRKVLAAHSLSWIGVQTMFVYMIAFVQQRFPALDADGTGRVLSISFLVLNASAAVIPALLLRPLALRVSQVRGHAASLAIMAAGYLAVHLFGHSPAVVYACMAVMGMGWAAIVSLPFAIMSQHVDPARIGLYMGVFNLAVVLPQLVVSLGIGSFVAEAADKGLVFLIGAISTGLSAACWLFVSDGRHAAAPPANAPSH
ncbi:MAG: MFS transporter [Pseudomonadota bacterium]